VGVRAAGHLKPAADALFLATLALPFTTTGDGHWILCH
jgi:hypothetical protein